MDRQAMRARAAIFLIALFACFGPLAVSAAPAPHAAIARHLGHRRPHQRARAPKAQLVYRIDRVTATIVRRKLVVTVDGAVPSGGWKSARLVAKPSAREAPVLAFEFVANPPGPKQVVIQELLPVHVTLTRGLPHYGTVAVEIIAKSNEVTTQIAR